MLIFGIVAGMSMPTNAETVKAMDEASTEAPLVLAQTAGTERRQDRRDTRQNCRQENGPSVRTSATANRTHDSSSL